jgi:predicted transcriptional regulator
MERLAISLRLPADLIQAVDAEAETKRRTRTLIFTEILEQRYHNNNHDSKPAPKTRKKAQAK